MFAPDRTRRTSALDERLQDNLSRFQYTWRLTCLFTFAPAISFGHLHIVGLLYRFQAGDSFCSHACWLAWWVRFGGFGRLVGRWREGQHPWHHRAYFSLDLSSHGPMPHCAGVNSLQFAWEKNRSRQFRCCPVQGERQRVDLLGKLQDNQPVATHLRMFSAC